MVEKTAEVLISGKEGVLGAYVGVKELGADQIKVLYVPAVGGTKNKAGWWKTLLARFGLIKPVEEYGPIFRSQLVPVINNHNSVYGSFERYFYIDWGEENYFEKQIFKSRQEALARLAQEKRLAEREAELAKIAKMRAERGIDKEKVEFKKLFLDLYERTMGG
jgi:hypothetical protein